MRKILYFISTIFFITAFMSCIKNDIPYPRIQANFTSLNVENQIGPAIIDSANRTITVTLNEYADIRHVKVQSFTLSDESYLVSSENSMEYLDLSQPDTVVLGLYQDYAWTIIGVQNIERYFGAVGEIGTPVIDVTNHRVVFTFPESMDLREVKIDSIKLGQIVSEMIPDLNGQIVDFSNYIVVDGTEFQYAKGQAVEVVTFGETVTWHIYVDLTESTVFTTGADAWTNVAWVYGECEPGDDIGIEYRRTNQTEWIKVPQEWMTINGGSITARIIHLTPETEYAARTYSGEHYATELVFTTQSTAQMPNSSFTYWTESANKKYWDPWGEGQEPYWDTGNKGASTLGTGNVEPTDDTSSGTGKAALLKTEYKGIGALGKLGAGSIFAGSYVKTDGTNGILSFGRTFTQRPTTLTGFFKYKTAPISDAQSQFNYMIGQPDTCIVWVALIDSEEPFEIRTNPNNRHLFNPDGQEVIAYGAMQYSGTFEEYRSFEITLDYKSTSRIPRYILCVASSSKYGDYFTGGRGAVMYLDDLELHFDYNE